MPWTMHYFDSTGEAYDACQCNEEIKTGDILVIEPEEVIGIADTWPVAVTVKYGELHTPIAEMTLLECMQDRCDAECVAQAITLAKAFGFEVRS